MKLRRPRKSDLLNRCSFGSWITIPHPTVAELLVRAGISFFTFQSMSYKIDVYRRRIPVCQKLKEFLLFVAFFPQLVAGPIMRAADLLGGNRRGPTRTQINLMLTMLLGGLWHGASWNFVIWGGLHGLALVAHKAWPALTGRMGEETPGSWLGSFAGWLLTLSTVLLGWIFFRASDFEKAWTMITRLATWQHSGTHSLSPQILASLAIVAGTHLLISKNANWPAWIVCAWPPTPRCSWASSASARGNPRRSFTSNSELHKMQLAKNHQACLRSAP